MKSKKTTERKSGAAVRVERIVSRLLDDIPTSWLDPLLTGPDAALSKDAGKWGCPDIERLLLAIKDRMRKTANDQAQARRTEGVDCK